MNLKPEELETLGYELVDSLDHQDIIPFVKKYLKAKTLFSFLYTFANILSLMLLAVWLWKCHHYNGIALKDEINYLSFGIILALALIPLHEFIHVLAYKSQGAKKTSYDANIRKFYFMAIADRFVANKKEFTIVALAPFVTISFGLLSLAALCEPALSITFLSAFLTHTACCSGDFGMLSYFAANKSKEVVTYDEKTIGVSYFYHKERI